MILRRPVPTAILALLLSTSSTAPCRAQVVNPADKQKPPEETEPAETDEIPTTTVTGIRVSELREEDRVGPYGQPEWTTHRRFPTTRVYVRPPGSFGFEYWLRPTLPRHGPSKLQTQYEFEIGLPNRFQLDLYLVSNQEGNEGPMEFDEQKFEIRWALADWGRIPANPTLYAELVHRDLEPDVIEAKLLLGDELCTGWHWGTNLVYEHETGGDLENVYEVTAGVSRVLVDQQLSLGGELKAALANTKDDRGEFEETLLVGPSLQYRPARNIHLDFATLVGLGADSPEGQAFFVLGYDF